MAEHHQLNRLLFGNWNSLICLGQDSFKPKRMKKANADNYIRQSLQLTDVPNCFLNAVFVVQQLLVLL